MVCKQPMKLFQLYALRFLYSSFFYILGIATVLFCSISFFIGQRFFLGLGTTDLHNFFLIIPNMMVIVVPALISLLPSVNKDYYLPLEDFKVIILNFTVTLFFLVAFVLLTIPIPICVASFGDVDIFQIICGYFGIMLYLTTAVSVTLYIKTLIPHNVIAFVGSIVALLFINNSHSIVSYISLPTMISSFFQFFSFAWHFNSFSKGILDSRDILFFLVTSVFFIFLSIIRYEWKRENQNIKLKRLLSIGTFTFFLLLIDSNKIFFQHDVTKNKKFSVSNYSRILLSEIEEPLSITYYCSSEVKKMYPQVKDINDFLQSYASKNKKVYYRLIDPAKEKMEKLLEDVGIKPFQIKTSNDSTTSYTSVYSSVSINYLDRTEIIPFILDTQTVEYDVSGRIQCLVRGIERNVQIVVGNGLSLEKDYSFIQPWLESQGFNVIQTFLPSQKGIGNLVFSLFSRVPMIVLGTTSFTKEDALALDYFIQRGGKVFIASTPYNIDTANDWSVINDMEIGKDNVSDMLKRYGIFFKESLTADAFNYKQLNYPLWPELPKQENAINGMVLFWPCSFIIDNELAKEMGFSVQDVLYTSKTSYQIERQNGKFDISPVSLINNPIENPRNEESLVCVSLNKDNNPCCMIMSDQYALNSNLISYISNNQGLNGTPDIRILDFLSDSILKLSDQSGLLEIKNKSAFNYSLYKENPMSVVSIIQIVILMPCMVLLGLFILFKIKRTKFASEVLK